MIDQLPQALIKQSSSSLLYHYKGQRTLQAAGCCHMVPVIDSIGMQGHQVCVNYCTCYTHSYQSSQYMFTLQSCASIRSVTNI